MKVGEYIKNVLELVRIEGQLEEIRRCATYTPQNALLHSRSDKLHRRKDEIRKKLDKEYTPLELAPVEQYIEIALETED